MQTRIRLARIGKRNAPAFKIVVANKRDKLTGRYLEVLGHYNPSSNPQTFDIDKKKYEGWLSKGAKPTKAVEKLVEGKYEFVPYTRQNEEDKDKKEEKKENNEEKGEQNDSIEIENVEEQPEEKVDESAEANN